MINHHYKLTLPYIKKIIQVFLSSLAILNLAFIIFFLTHNFLDTRDEAELQVTKDLVNVQNDIYDIIEFFLKFRELVSTEFDFMDFITSDELKNGGEYYEFRKNKLSDLEDILAINNLSDSLRIYVRNPVLIDVPPIIRSERYSNNEELRIVTFGENYRLHYVTKIIYRQKEIAIEFMVPLENIVENRNSQVKFAKYNEMYDNEKENSIYFIGNKAYLEVPNIKLKLEAPINGDDLYAKFISYGVGLFLVSSLFLVSLFFLAYRFLRPQFMDMAILLESVGQIKSGKFDGTVDKLSNDSELKVYSTELQDAAENMKTLIDEAVTRQRELQEAEQKTLQAQINSHFLANSLEAVKMKALIKKDYEISDSLTDLGHMLRYAIELDRQFVTIEEELEYTERFINLYSMKQGFEIEYVVELDNELCDVEVPKLIIEPFVENAVEHGILPLKTQGFVFVKVGSHDGNIQININDNGVGLKNCTLDKDGFPMSGIGIKNIRERVKKYYGDNGFIEYHWGEKGTFVTITLGRLLNA